MAECNLASRPGVITGLTTLLVAVILLMFWY